MTELQQKTYEWVRLYIVERGISPLLEEIADHFGVHMTTIFVRFDALVQAGILIRVGNRARNLRLPDVCPACGQPVKRKGVTSV